MKTVLAEMLTSKKFLAAIAAVIVYVAGHFGFDIAPAALDPIWQILLVYVGAQGLADIGKSAKQASPGPAVTTRTEASSFSEDVATTTTTVVVEPPRSAFPPPLPPTNPLARKLGGSLVLVLLLGLAGAAAPGCATTQSQRATTIQTAQVVVTTAANGMLAYDKIHQDELARSGTPDEAAAALKAYRAKRAKFDLALTATADAIIVAVTLNDQPSLDGLARAIAEVIRDYQDLKGKP